MHRKRPRTRGRRAPVRTGAAAEEPTREGRTMEHSNQVDAAIIGYGAAAKPLAVALADAGQTVAVIERSHKMYGGACVNTACLPSKMLVHAAEVSAFEGGEFPARAERFQAAVNLKNQATSRLRERNYRVLADHPGVEVIDGEASFIDTTHLRVRTDEGERTLEATRTFIDTGSEPKLPPIPGLDGSRVYTSESLLDVEVLPETAIIIGAGYVGLEFASLFADFGVDVTVMQSGTDFLPREDAEVARVVRANFEQRGIHFMLGANVKAVEDDVAEALVVVDVDGKESRLTCDLVLVATGRRAAVDHLNLEAAGVRTDERGTIVTDEHLRTTAPNIWAMGDAAEAQQFTYVSYDGYRIVASDVLGDGSYTLATRGAVPSCIFADPPIAHVGLTEKEARDQGFEVATATLTADDMPKVPLLGKEALLMKAVVDASTDRVLGVHLYCTGAPEIVNLAKRFLDDNATAADFRDAVFTHPTVTEELNNLFASVGK
ncbi:FAD-dependent oxidoreductase [Gordonibacter sp.]|nr:FAD-dependent oxidoreductase [Gordonibacter sp.]